MKPMTIRRTVTPPEFRGLWDGPVWSRSETFPVANFHPRSSEHRPDTSARILYDDTAVYLHFKVLDRYVRSVNTEPQSSVCQDSCVEFFFQPRSTPGYLNMESNAGGTFLCSYIEDHRRVPDGYARFQLLDNVWFGKMRVYHSLPAVVDPELPGPVTWQLEYSIPLSLIEAYSGPLGSLAGQTWRVNFYKCGDRTSHPHWASWAPMPETLNFHQPDTFQPITFAP